MKKVVSQVILFVTLSVVFSSCSKESLFAIRGEGDVVSQEVQLATIEGIDMQIDANVVITQGESQSVIIEAQQNIIDNIELDVRNGLWKIDHKHRVRKHKQITIYITVKDISEIAISGSGDISSTNVLSTNLMKLVISGSGNMDMQVDANKVDVVISGSGDVNADVNTDSFSTKISGSGDIDVFGVATDIDLTISGSGNFNSYGCESSTADITISGSGDMYINASESISVKISGSGNVYYKQHPSVSTNISGSGDLIYVN